MTLALILSVVLAQGQDPPRLRVSPLPQTLVLDGRMREPVWTTADSAVLTEFEPELGTVPAERTVVKVLASADELVFGIRCDDPEPDKLTSFARARDADLSAEDHVRIVLDPFLSEQSGYVFAVNPNGARYDALISEQAQRLGGRENPDWDTIWEAATARSGEGWSVEIRIPVKGLLYKPGLAEWGFNVQRRVQRKLETERWAFPGRNWRITQMSRADRPVQRPDGADRGGHQGKRPGGRDELRRARRAHGRGAGTRAGDGRGRGARQAEHPGRVIGRVHRHGG